MRYFFLVERTDFCNRVGCAREADCVLLMVPQSRKAWIVDTDHDKAIDGSALCEIHAAELPFHKVGNSLMSDPRVAKRRESQKRR